MQESPRHRSKARIPVFTIIGSVNLFLAVLLFEDGSLLKYVMLATALLFYLASVVQYFRKSSEERSIEK